MCTPRVVSVSGRFRLSRFHWPTIVGRNMKASTLSRNRRKAFLCFEGVRDGNRLYSRDEGSDVPRSKRKQETTPPHSRKTWVS